MLGYGPVQENENSNDMALHLTNVKTSDRETFQEISIFCNR